MLTDSKADPSCPVRSIDGSASAPRAPARGPYPFLRPGIGRVLTIWNVEQGAI